MLSLIFDSRGVYYLTLNYIDRVLQLEELPVMIMPRAFVSRLFYSYGVK